MNPPANLPESTTKKYKNFKLIAVVATSALFLGLAIWGFYAWAQQNELDNSQTKIVQMDKRDVSGGSDKSETLSTTLPNGKTATYADTESNRNIVFSDSDKGMMYVDLSHKSVERFIATVDEYIVSRLCGPNGERAAKDNIIIATMSTEHRTVEYSTTDNCLSELATMRNSDSSSRAKASELIEQAESDIRRFYATVIIK